MAGYSKTPLVKKLGIKEGDTLRIINQPESFLELLQYIPKDIKVVNNKSSECTFLMAFFVDQADLFTQFAILKAQLNKSGMLWIAWPKKTSKVKTDLNENIIREHALANGLVDVKVCAIDDIWSGLKLVYRLQDRQV